MTGRPDEPGLRRAEPMKGFDDFELCLGDIMRGERATMGKSLLDVQRELKIKATYIAAIENADPTAFESPGFVAGYVRSYARYLGLDADWAFRTFCEEGKFAHAGGLSAKEQREARPAARPASAPTGRDPFASPSVAFLPQAESRFSGIEPGAIGSVAVLVALLGAIGYGGWSVLQGVQKVRFTPVEQTPGVLAELDPVQPAPDSPVAGDEVAALPSAEAFDRLYRPQALDVPVLTPRDGPIAAITPGSLGVFADLEPPARAETVAKGTDQAAIDAVVAGLAMFGPPMPDEGSGVQVVAEGPPKVELFAVRPAWVRVRAADGKVIFEKILDAGERFELPATEEPHTLRAGNAGSVYFDVGGRTYGPAGPGVSVAKNVVLSPEDLPQSYALADPEADADLARFVAVAEAQPD